jgi:hypothetical protein
MAPKPGMLALVFGMVLAMAVTILSITTWAGPRILRASRQRRPHRRKRYTGLTIGLCTKGRQSSAAA